MEQIHTTVYFLPFQLSGIFLQVSKDQDKNKRFRRSQAKPLMRSKFPGFLRIVYVETYNKHI